MAHSVVPKGIQGASLRGTQKRSRRVTAVIGLFTFGLVVSAGVGWLGAASSLAEPHVSAVVYLSEEAEAALYYSDVFGNIVPEQVLTAALNVGVNTLRFPVGDDIVANSLVQRLDLCACDSPVLVSSISLATTLFSERLHVRSWTPGGDLVEFHSEGSAVLMRPPPGSADPQIFLYADIVGFAVRAELAAFWVFFGFSGALILTVVGVISALRRASAGGTIRPDTSFVRPRVFRSEQKIPLALAVFTAAVAIVAGAQQFAGAWVTGVTIDEPAHVRHLANYFETGVYSSSVYGPFTSLFGHALNVILGNEAWGMPLATLEAYQGRHMAVALIGFLGLLAVGVSAWAIFGSARWAFVAAAFLGSIPVWVGHSMFNVKDIPVASGYALFTAGLIVVLAPRLPGWRSPTLALGLLGVGVLVGAGTRPGAMALMLGSAFVLGVLWFATRHQRGGRRLPTAVVLGGTAAFLGMGALLLLFSGPGAGLVAGIRRSLDFPWTGFNLYAGQLVSERPGAAVIAMVFASYLPLFVLFFVVAGIVFGVVRLIQESRPGGVWSPRESAFVLISAQASVGFVALATLNPTVYDGGRQLLFAFPAFALLAVYGLYAVLRALPFVLSSGRLRRRIVLGVMVAGFSIITVDQVRFFPFNYSLYNEIAQGSGISGRWETDYWASSVREGARYVAPGDPAICGVTGTHNFNVGTSLPPACETLSPYVGTAARAEQSLLSEREFWVIRIDRTLINRGPISSDNCRLHHEVTRPFRGEDVVMSRVYICRDL